MTDFLTRLAARQLGEVQAVAPRVAALFEPGAAEKAVPQPEERNLTGTEPSLPPLRAPSAGDRHLPLDPADVEGTTIDDHRQPPDHQVRYAAAVSRSSPSHVSPRPNIQKGAGLQETVRTKEPAGLSPRLRRPSPQEPLDIAPIRIADESRADPPALAPLDRIALRTAPLEKEQPKALSVSREVRHMPNLVGRGAPAGVPAVEPMIMPVRSSEGRRSRDDAGGGGKVSGEPVVHVTIGRIEVTAVTAAPAKRATTPRGAPSLLDNYLAQCRTRKP
jgi:hypothetical protein